MNPCFFIFGFGYTANALAQKLHQLGIESIGTTRQPTTSDSDHASIGRRIDFNDPEIESYLSKANYLLISTPPIPDIGDPVLSQYGELIKKHSAHIQWVGYLSSTSVYGDHQGNWVDEKSDCHPHGSSGILRLKAEETWLAYAKANHIPLHIFRLAGIYGPDRNPIQRTDAGKKYSIFKEGQFFSRIHVDNIVSVLLASIKASHPLSIYNVADDEPAPSHVVDAYASWLLKRAALPLTPFEKASLSPMEKEFYSNNRQVSNLKIKQELHVALKYPSFREGLDQIWREDFSEKYQ